MKKTVKKIIMKNESRTLFSARYFLLHSLDLSRLWMGELMRRVFLVFLYVFLEFFMTFFVQCDFNHTIGASFTIGIP